MAKKKQIVINEEELTPTTLAVVEDKKKVSILGIFWLFLIFAIFIILLKVLINKDFSCFLPAIIRFEEI